ncbi:MAG TPA: hypothetical protein VGA37_02710 [Gemmatimonadales bacterium]
MNAPCWVTSPPSISSGLLEAVAALVARVTGHEPAMSPRVSDRLARLVSPLDFPDGVGSGSIITQLHAIDDRVELTLRLEHDRVFATPQRTASANRCFLNDYVASVTLPAGSESLPEKFVREVVAGVSAACHAVERHNGKHAAPWFKIVVAVAYEAVPTTP